MWGGRRIPFACCLASALGPLLCGCLGRNHVDPDYRFRTDHVEELREQLYRGEFGAQYLRQASNYSADVIACATDICEYIYKTHGRFPAHCEAIHVPGVWLQTHHVEEEYYERFFRNGLTDVHRNHDRTWHA